MICSRLAGRAGPTSLTSMDAMLEQGTYTSVLGIEGEHAAASPTASSPLQRLAAVIRPSTLTCTLKTRGPRHALFYQTIGMVLILLFDDQFV